MTSLTGLKQSFQDLPKSELLTQIETEKRRRSKISLIDYLRYTNHGNWYPAKHLELLCHALEDVEAGVAAGTSPRLIISMPPRHGKSEVASKGFPAWVLGRHPDWEIILTAYGSELAEDFSRICRDKVREFGKDIFGIELSRDSASISRWGLKDHRGGMTATGAGGAITGRGAHIAIIDDPYKGAEQAHSPTQRRKIIDWYKSVLYTRLAPGGAIILIQTRWHQDDLAGYLLKDHENGGEEWQHINFPAIAEEGDILNRRIGQPLWAERYPISSLNAIRRSQGEYYWNALYQQHPSDPAGGLFKRQYFRYYEKDNNEYVLHSSGGDKRILDTTLTIFQTCDTAASLKNTADYFVLSTWGLTRDSDLLLLDVIRDRFESPDQPEILKTAYDRWHPIAQGIEVKFTGIALYQELVRLGLPVVELYPDGDKVLRARPMAARYKAGTVYHPKYGQYVSEYEEELIGFPNAPHDDQVDTASYAFVMMQDLSGTTRPYQTGDLY